MDFELELLSYANKINKYLDIKSMKFFLNNNKELLESTKKIVFLINLSDFNYEEIDKLKNKFNELTNFAVEIDFVDTGLSKEEIVLKLKEEFKNFRKIAFQNDIDLTDVDVEKEFNGLENDTNENVLNETIEDEDFLTPEDKEKIRLKKLPLKEKFAYIKKLDWFKKFRNNYVKFYIVARKKVVEERYKDKQLSLFLKYYNEVFETHLNTNNITREFALIYEKEVVNFGFKNAIRIWVAVAVLIILAIIIPLMVIYNDVMFHGPKK